MDKDKNIVNRVAKTKTAEKVGIYEQHCKKWLELIRVYLDNLEQFGFSGNRPELANKINEMLDFLGAGHLKWMKMLTKSAECATDGCRSNSEEFTIYFLAQKGIDFMNTIVNILLENKPSFAHMGSTSSGSTITKEHIVDIIMALEAVEESFNHLRILFSNIGLEEIIYGEIGKIAINAKYINEIVDIYMSFVSKGDGKYVVDLYCFVLNEILLNVKDADVLAIAHKQTENLKTRVLQIKEWGDTNRWNNTIQLLIQKMRLIPDCESIPLPELISKYFEIKVKTSGSDNIEIALGSIVKSIGAGFIVIYKICGNLEYRFQSVLGDEVRSINPRAGINEKFAKITETIHPLTIELGKRDLKKNIARIVRIGDDVADKFYVIDTLDGIRFRMLRMWDGQDLAIPRQRLQALGKPSATPSLRIAGYNLIQNQELCKYIDEPIFHELEHPTSNYWQILRERIVLKLEEYTSTEIKKIIGAKLTTAGKQKLAEFLISAEMIDHIITAIIEVILQNLTKNFKHWESLDAKTSQQLKEEITISYLGELQNIQRKLKNEIEHTFTQMSEKIRETGDIAGIIAKTLENALETFVSKSGNVFLNIENKLQILDVGLIKK